MAQPQLPKRPLEQNLGGPSRKPLRKGNHKLIFSGAESVACKSPWFTSCSSLVYVGSQFPYLGLGPLYSTPGGGPEGDHGRGT